MPIPQLNRRARTYGEIDVSAPRRHHFKNKRALLKKLLLAGGVLVAIGIIFVTILVAWVSRDLPDPNNLSDRQISQSTKIYDRTGEHLLYEIYQNQKRTNVDLAQMSPWLAKATIAVEDKNFYQHNGIRPLSIIRAAINNLLGRSAGSGGASTITQQFIKNSVIGNEHSIFRKIKEAILALRLETKYSKDEILKMYLNDVPYGSTNYGVESASQSYFHKKAADIDLAESATLAAIIQAPTRYLNNPDALRDRRDLVLRLMFDQGYITEQEKNNAQGSALRIYRSGGIMDAPHFVLYVKQLLTDQFGEKEVDTDGLKVITTLDYDKQKAAEKIIKEQGDKFAKEDNADNASLVAIDPKTGQILAMVGSRDFENEEISGQFNVATLGLRQPGSSLKPFIYAAAWEKGFTPETVLYDVVTNFDRRSGGNYTPHNYDGKEHGLLTMRKAIQGSLNIPAVKTLYLVGQDKVTDVLARFGYSTLDKAAVERAGLSLVLGGAEVNLLEHTSAYATLANNGTRFQTESILSVSNNQGDKLWEWKNPEGTEAMKPEIVALVDNVLSDDAARAYIFGAHGNLTLPDRPVAAKTGTTNDNKDAWAMGYTPSVAVGVWVGNTKNTPMKAGGNTLAGKIWNLFMREATKNTPVENFPTPPENDANKPVLKGADGGIKILVNRLNGKIATSSTPASLISEKIFLPPHDILQYVNKDDPRGPAPTNPADDPQYDNWETSLNDWVERMKKEGKDVSLEEPPTETDNAVVSELTPQVTFVSPTDGQTITNRQMTLEVRATSPRGVTKVTFQVDGLTVGSVTSFPFKLDYLAKTLANSNHAVHALAEDDQGNFGEKTINFKLDAEMGPPDFDWGEQNPLTLTKEDFPRSITLLPFRWSDAKELNIYLTSGTNKRLIYSFNTRDDKPTTARLAFTWKNFPGAGEHILTGELIDNNGNIKKHELIIRAQ